MKADTAAKNRVKDQRELITSAHTLADDSELKKFVCCSSASRYVCWEALV